MRLEETRARQIGGLRGEFELIRVWLRFRTRVIRADTAVKRNTRILDRILEIHGEIRRREGLP